jgi:hypothetical protein
MKFFQSGGKQEFDPLDFLQYILRDHLQFSKGNIMFADILEREKEGNKGNALDGMIKLLYSELATGLNIGGNPIGTGYNNFISFLDEIECKTESGLYVMDDLVDKEVYVVFCNDTSRGILTPKGFDEFYDAIKSIQTH